MAQVIAAGTETTNMAPMGQSGTEKPLVGHVNYNSIIVFALVSLVALVGVPLFGYLYGYTWVDWTMFGVLYTVTGLGITVGYHRLFSHRSFSCPNPVRFAFLIAGGWALENSALMWCADHVRHHAKVDTYEDPYNAKKGFWWSHVVWIFIEDPYRTEKYFAQFRKDKLIMWQHKYYLPIVVTGLALPFVVGTLYGGWMSGLGCFLLAGVGRIFLVLNSTFFINSICHMWGDQPNGTQNTSRDSWLISLITFGEGYHNYHHAYPKDYRNGFLWYNFDPSKWLIFTLSLTGMASNLTRLGVRAG